jgi:Na+/H+-translocating membrane pyrophosphatase
MKYHLLLLKLSTRMILLLQRHFLEAYWDCDLHTYLFGPCACSEVGQRARKVVNKVQNQPSIITYQAKPDYGHCVPIVASASLHEMTKPGALIVISLIAIGVLFKILGRYTDQILLGTKVTAMFMFATISSIIVPLFFNNTGGA